MGEKTISLKGEVLKKKKLPTFSRQVERREGVEEGECVSEGERKKGRGKSING